MDCLTKKDFASVGEIKGAELNSMFSRVQLQRRVVHVLLMNRPKNWSWTVERAAAKSEQIQRLLVLFGHQSESFGRGAGRCRGFFVSKGQKHEARADLTEWVSNWGQCTSMAVAAGVEWHIYKWLASAIAANLDAFSSLCTRYNNIREA